MEETAAMNGIRISQLMESLVSMLTVYARSLEQKVIQSDESVLKRGNSMTQFEVIFLLII